MARNHLGRQLLCPSRIRQVLVWDKRNDQTTFADCELAWTNLDGAVRQFRWMWSGPYQQQREERWHPTQKPLALMKWCVAFIPRRKLFLTPHGQRHNRRCGGSNGRDFIGIEREESYFEIACRRIEQAQRPRRPVHRRRSMILPTIAAVIADVLGLGQRTASARPPVCARICRLTASTVSASPSIATNASDRDTDDECPNGSPWPTSPPPSRG
jgi:hypothetical protein